MPYYIDAANKLYYLDDSANVSYLPTGCTPITDAQAATLQAPTSAQQAAAANFQDYLTSKTAAQGDAVIQYLMNHTPAQCAAYVQTNVVDLPSAVSLLSKVAVALCVLSKAIIKQ